MNGLDRMMIRDALPTECLAPRPAVTHQKSMLERLIDYVIQKIFGSPSSTTPAPIALSPLRARHVVPERNTKQLDTVREHITYLTRTASILEKAAAPGQLRNAFGDARWIGGRMLNGELNLERLIFSAEPSDLDSFFDPLKIFSRTSEAKKAINELLAQAGKPPRFA
jgi:hypothetical protein